MGEPDPSVAHGGHLRPGGLVQGGTAGTRHGVHQLDGRLRHPRRRGEGTTRLGRQRAEAGIDERLERHGQPFARLELQRARLERAPELQGEERVAARQLVQAPHHRTRREEPEPVLDQPLDGAEAQGRQAETLELERAVQLQRHRLAAAGAPGHDHADRNVVQPPGREAEHQFGGSVQPLHVVDREYERALGCEPPEHAEQAEGHAVLIRRLPVRVAHEQRHLQGAARPGRHRGDGLRLPAEKVTERRVREARLRLRRTGGEASHLPARRAGKRRLPDRGLAGAGFAFDEERAGPVPDGAQEELHPLELLLSADELRAHNLSRRGYLRVCRGPRAARRSGPPRWRPRRVRRSRGFPCIAR